MGIDGCNFPFLNVGQLARLSSLGGNSLKDTTRIIMERTLRKDVQCRFSLLGRRPPKLAFRGTRLCTAIIGMVFSDVSIALAERKQVIATRFGQNAATC